MAGTENNGKYIRTAEHKRILSVAQKLRYKNGGVHPRGTLGKHWKRSEIANQRLSESRKLFFLNGGKHPKGMLGKKHNKETMMKLKEASSGGNNARWLGGISVNENEARYRTFYERRRSIRKLGNGGSHTIEQWQELKRKYNYMCLCCKQQEPFIKLTEDHIVPVICGGVDDISNIQPLCKSCNSRKNVKIFDYRINFKPKCLIKNYFQ